MKRDIFHCEDHREFLKQVFQERKAQNPAFGLRQFCRKAGFSSPSSLSMIINGKRNLTLTIAEKIADALGMSGRRRKYLFAMAALQSAKSPEEKQRLREELFRLRNLSKGTLLNLTHYRFLSTWYYPAIYVMASLRLFKPDATWIAAQLGRGVTVAQAQAAVDDLLQLRLLERKNGTLLQAQGSLTTNDDVIDLSIRKYHASMIGLALDSLELPLDRREVNGLTVPVPRDQLPKVKEMIRAFRRELSDYLEPFSSADDVYQLNVQFFPLVSPRESNQEPSK